MAHGTRPDRRRTSRSAPPAQPRASPRPVEGDDRAGIPASLHRDRRGRRRQRRDARKRQSSRAAVGAASWVWRPGDSMVTRNAADRRGGRLFRAHVPRDRECVEALMDLCSLARRQALDRVERVTQFTAFEIRAPPPCPAGANEEQAQRLLQRAETTCLVTNSLKAAPRLEASVEVVATR